MPSGLRNVMYVGIFTVGRPIVLTAVVALAVDVSPGLNLVTIFVEVVAMGVATRVVVLVLLLVDISPVLIFLSSRIMLSIFSGLEGIIRLDLFSVEMLPGLNPGIL